MANRFSQQGQGAQGGSWASGEQRIGDMARRSVEEKNNNATSELQKQIAQLKGLAIDINDEVQDQNRLLDGMDGQMGSAGDMMSETIGKLGTMLNSPDGKHMIYLIGGVVFVFIMVYYAIMYRHSFGGGEEVVESETDATIDAIGDAKAIDR